MRGRRARPVACTCGQWWMLVLLGSPAEGMEGGRVDGLLALGKAFCALALACRATPAHGRVLSHAHMPAAIVVVGVGGGGVGWDGWVEGGLDGWGRVCSSCAPNCTVSSTCTQAGTPCTQPSLVGCGGFRGFSAPGPLTRRAAALRVSTPDHQPCLDVLLLWELYIGGCVSTAPPRRPDGSARLCSGRVSACAQQLRVPALWAGPCIQI